MACIRMTLRSRALDMDTIVNVVIPYDCFDRNGNPGKFSRTLYLLHGLRQNADAWQRLSSAERYANYYGYALVMPDAQRSFYTDMAHGPRFFTYLTEELPRTLHGMFKIPDDPAHTYVGGLSMGGYGALKLGLRKSEMFSYVAALSASPDAAKRRYTANGDTKTYWEDVFGPLDQIEGSFNDLFAAARELDASEKEKPRIYMWCGTEDALFPDNEKMRDCLKENHFDLTWEQSAGCHAWKYWDEKIQTVLAWLPLKGGK